MKMRLVEILDEIFKDVKFNKDLAKRFYQFQIGFVNKNEEHMLFFGGNLLGVQVVRFLPSDYNNFFNVLLDVDSEKLKHDIEHKSTINTDFKVSSDEFNIACFYCMYRFLNSPYLSPNERERAATDACLIYQYKITCSLLAHYFRYPVDPDIAQATYASLSNRFLIKKLGSWGEVFNYRCEEILREDGLHYHIFKNFSDDKAITYVIADTQGRIRDMLKNITAEFKKVHVSGERIDVSSSTDITLDGNEIIKDKIHGPDIYVRYVMSVMADEYTFIKEELFAIVVQALPGINSRLFRTTLQWFSEQSHGKYSKEIDQFIRQVLIYTIEYLNRDGKLLQKTRDILDLTINIKNLYLASRSTDMELKEIRDNGSNLIAVISPTSSESVVSNIRTGVILYLTLRAFTKHYYHD